MRKWRYGTEKVGLKTIRGNDLVRFYSNIELDKKTGCWLWQRKLDLRGYGRMYPDMAHRWSYKHFKGNIPDDLVIHHKCYTPACVNPEHLEITTHRENIIEKGRSNAAHINSLKKFCINGHSFIDAHIRKTKYGISRSCRQCQKDRSRVYRERIKRR